MSSKLEAARQAVADATERVRSDHAVLEERAEAKVRRLAEIRRALVPGVEAKARLAEWTANLQSEDAFQTAAGAFLCQSPGDPFMAFYANEGTATDVLKTIMPLIADGLVKKIGASIDRADAGERIASADYPAIERAAERETLDAYVEVALSNAAAAAAGVALPWRSTFPPQAFFAAFTDTAVNRVLALVDDCATAHAVALRASKARNDCREERNAARDAVERAKRPAIAGARSKYNGPIVPKGIQGHSAEMVDPAAIDLPVPDDLAAELARREAAFGAASDRCAALEEQHQNLMAFVTALRRYARDHQLAGWQLVWNAKASAPASMMPREAVRDAVERVQA
jgi:hypothetical protein